MIRDQIAASLADVDEIDADWQQEAGRLDSLLTRAKAGEVLSPGLLLAVLDDLDEVLEDQPEAGLALMRAVSSATADGGGQVRALHLHSLERQAEMEAEDGQTAAALRTHRAIVAAFDQDEDSAVCAKVIESQFFIAEALRDKKGKIAAEIALYDAIINRHDGRAESLVRDLVTRAKMLRALRLPSPGGAAEQIDRLDSFLAQSCTSTAPGTVAVVADGFVALVDLVTAQSGPAAAQIVRNRMLAWAVQPDLPVPSDPLAAILLGKFTAAADLGDWAAARDAAQMILDRVANSCEPTYRLFDLVFTGGCDVLTSPAVAVLFDLAPGRRDPNDLPLLQMLLLRQAVCVRDAGQLQASLPLFVQSLQAGEGIDHDRARIQRAHTQVEIGLVCSDLKDQAQELAYYNACIADWRDDDNLEVADLRLIALLNTHTTLVAQENNAAAEEIGQILLDRAGAAKNPERRLQIAQVQCHRIAMAQYLGDMENLYKVRLDFLEVFGRDYSNTPILVLIVPEALLAMRAAVVRGQRHVVKNLCWSLWDLVDHLDDHALLVQICRAALECGLYLQSCGDFDDAMEQFYGVCRGFQDCSLNHPDYQSMLDLAAHHLEQCRQRQPIQPVARGTLQRLTQSLRDLFGA